MSSKSWQQRKLGELISLEYGAGLRKAERTANGFPVYGSSGVVGWHREPLVSIPGIIIGRKGTVGATFWSDTAFWAIDTVYYVKMLDDIHLRWLYWLLTYLPLEKLNSSTGVPGLNRNDIYQLEFLVPSDRDEQHTIAAILDTIDDVVRSTEQLIDKLKQTRAGLLHDLLTYGIDENGDLRFTNHLTENTYGKFPQHWDIVKLGDVAEVVSGLTLGRDLSGVLTVELPYLRVFNVQDGFLDLSDVKTIHVRPEEIEKYRLQPGDILMNEGGDYDKLGRGTVWRGEIELCLHQNHVFRVRPKSNKLNSDFLAIICGSNYGRRFFLLSSKQSTNLASINSTQLKGFPVPLPCPEEQTMVIEKVQGFDKALESEKDYLNKLRLLRQGLMDDLLTGRVRVTAHLKKED